MNKEEIENFQNLAKTTKGSACASFIGHLISSPAIF